MSVKNYNKVSDNEISFEIHDADVSIPNGIRRVAMNKIPTYAFDEFDIRVNRTSFNNDFIEKRLELIPIKYSEELEDVEFVLRAESDGTLTDVFSSSLKASNGKKYFDEDILILTLKNIQEVEFTCRAKKNIGSEHAKHQPISAIAYEYVIDPKKAAKLDKSESNYETLIQRQNITDKYGNIAIKLTIEGIGMFSSDEIVRLAIGIIQDKLDFLEKSIKEKNIEKLQVIKFTPIDNTNDYIINNEEHTIGCLITNHAQKNKKCSYAGYKKNPALEEKIVIRITGDKVSPDTIILEAIEEVRSIYKDLLKQFNSKK